MATEELGKIVFNVFNESMHGSETSPAGLTRLSLRSWRGGANGGMGVDDEWHATGGHTYELALTSWPRLGRPSFSPFIREPLENYPLEVRAKLSCSGRYGATLSINVDQHRCSELGTSWKGPCSAASAQRRALAFVYDRQEELARAALAAYYGARIHGLRCVVFDEEGGQVATFICSNDAFHSDQLPRRFYTASPRRNGETWVSWCRRDGSSRSASSGDDVAARLQALIQSRPFAGPTEGVGDAR